MQTLPDCPSPQVCVCVCVCVCLCWALVVTYRLSCPEACEISVPQPKIKPTSPALEDGFLATGCLVAQSCPTLCRPMDCIACQAPLSMGFSQQEYWSGLPFPSPA